MAEIKKRGKIYYLRLQHGGRETWISTHRTTERDARRVADRIETEFKRERQTKELAGKLLEFAKQIARKELSMEEFPTIVAQIEHEATQKALDLVDSMIPAPVFPASDLWARYMERGTDLKPSTLETKKQRFGKFIAWAGTRDMRDMSETSCRAFLRSLGAIKSHTRNNYIAELSSVWRAFPELDNPWGEHLREKLVVEHKRPFTIDQVRAILKFCKENNEKFWHSAAMIAYYTGLRLKDVVMLERSQITPDGYIDLVPAKTSGYGKHVRIPIKSELAEELRGIRLGSLKYFFPEQVKTYNRNRGILTMQSGRPEKWSSSRVVKSSLCVRMKCVRFLMVYIFPSGAHKVHFFAARFSSPFAWEGRSFLISTMCSIVAGVFCIPLTAARHSSLPHDWRLR